MEGTHQPKRAMAVAKARLTTPDQTIKALGLRDQNIPRVRPMYIYKNSRRR
jgi:hypothetical protein